MTYKSAWALNSEWLQNYRLSKKTTARDVDSILPPTDFNLAPEPLSPTDHAAAKAKTIRQAEESHANDFTWRPPTHAQELDEEEYYDYDYDEYLDDYDITAPTRETTLNNAKTLISGQRAKDYGDPQESFTRIANIWTAILNTPITPSQAALMLAGLKMARLAHTPNHQDSWTDLAGYAALGAEVSS